MSNACISSPVLISSRFRLVQCRMFLILDTFFVSVHRFSSSFAFSSKLNISIFTTSAYIILLNIHLTNPFRLLILDIIIDFYSFGLTSFLIFLMFTFILNFKHAEFIFSVRSVSSANLILLMSLFKLHSVRGFSQRSSQYSQPQKSDLTA